ncbi:K+/H+ antiporter subunit F [Brucella melitensis]|uniref:K+/H+ antiporter subunit F n=1 Tax=Brucella melitensis TaxID=29459 RepID=UPI0001B5936E|nr:K+/H+ antiporter subunit F [Brucella melitensis]AIJ86870.1 multiple resistance and pH regulation F family protein [Brucella melitensis bv. 3 str. Ether]EEZ09972.1 multiple resistance and pH regulation protein F [Brucella melitensis bv. 3 str. Ether]KKO93847.1 monovalent cation/H+ antiporter subunit F [Brucella melitensis]SPU56576.1 monovalent cation/H+ antiporter subunit F [Brucella melitensis]
MSAVLIFWALLAAQVMLVAAMGCAVYRLLVGPRAQDRILATDALYLDALLLLLTFGIRTGSIIYFEATLIIALLGFVATVALSKFLMRGEVIE